MQVEISEQTGQCKLRRYALSALVLLDGDILGTTFAQPRWDGKADSYYRMRDALITGLAHRNGWEINRVDICITSFVHCWGEDGAVGEDGEVNE